MFKKLLLTAALLFFVVSATAMAQINVGYMNTQEVLNELPESEQVQKEINAFIQEKQAQLSQRATEYQDEVAEYESNSASMSPDQRQKREQELTAKLTALEEFDQSIRLQIQQKREELLAPIFERIDGAIADIAEAENLDFVFNELVNAGQSVIFYASDNQLDITRRVITKLTSSTR